MRLFRRRLGWLSTLTLFLLLVALLAGHVAAQNRDGGSQGNKPAVSDEDSPSDKAPANQPSKDEENDSTDEPANDQVKADNDDDEGDSNADNDKSDSEDEGEDDQTDEDSDKSSTDSDEEETSTEDSSESETTEESTPTDDNKPPPLTEATSTSTTNTLPSITSTTSTSSSTSSFDFPVATVPPTKNAPYMKESNLPEGTVFIAVGAALGLVGLAVLAWRALVVWSINRSVRRAAIQHTKTDSKTALTGGAAGGKRKRRRSRRRSRRNTYGAEMSMEKLSRDRHASHISSSSRNPATQSGLFYSPTAAPSGHQGASSHRGSSYLPAGYYSAGSAGGPRMSHLGSQTPPASPSLPPSRGHDVPFNRASHFGGASTSSLNLNAPPQGRAPSAYLEDLFESHGSARPNDFR
ncbi:hypothetical protein VTN49DRAFT_2067 [Thermomyces lanuginosus]|uniref:uncharacterized protein n=1 Tax=Thermomyces lanuginosus TaxID=5541 RepID=UPI0037439450